MDLGLACGSLWRYLVACDLGVMVGLLPVSRGLCIRLVACRFGGGVMVGLLPVSRGLFIRLVAFRFGGVWSCGALPCGVLPCDLLHGGLLCYWLVR